MSRRAGRALWLEKPGAALGCGQRGRLGRRVRSPWGGGAAGAWPPLGPSGLLRGGSGTGCTHSPGGDLGAPGKAFSLGAGPSRSSPSAPALPGAPSPVQPADAFIVGCVSAACPV